MVELAGSARGIEVGVFAAHSRGISSAKSEVLLIDQLFMRLRRVIVGGPALIVCSTKILVVDGSAMMGRRSHVRVLSEHRRGDGSGKNSDGSKCFEFGHNSPV
jgi:hypothetical protein